MERHPITCKPEGTDMHTPHPPTAQSDPAFIRWILAAIILAVIAVAFVANGAALLGGVAFVRSVMQQPEIVAWTFGGSIELALGVVSAAMYVEAYRLQPVGRLRTAVWALSGVSGTFGALFEIMEYLTGHLTLPAALSAAGWRIFAPFLAAGLWELVIYLVCGHRHRAHRAAERRHDIMFKFFKAGERQGLAVGKWHAPIAAMRARAALRTVTRTLHPDEAETLLARYLHGARFGQDVLVQSATLAATTLHRMSNEITPQQLQPEQLQAPALQVQLQSATVQGDEPVQLQPAPTVQGDEPVQLQPAPTVQPVPQAQGNEAEPVQAERDDAYTARAHAAEAAEVAAIVERRAVVRQLLRDFTPTSHARKLTGTAVMHALHLRGYQVSERTAYSDLSAVKSIGT
jgi:hypothetical protein